MKRAKLFVGALMLIFGIGVQHVQAQISGDKEPPVPTLDTRVLDKLTRADIKFNINKFNDFTVLYNMGKGRTQLAVISSYTEKYLSLETREIRSIAMQTHMPLSANAANRLLRDNTKFGGWRVSFYKGTYTVFFATYVAADCDSQTLKDAIDLVVAAADKMERELTGKDEF